MAIRAFGLGLRVDHGWFCSDRCVEAETARRLRTAPTAAPLWQRPTQQLGAILLQQRKITAEQLKLALVAQRKSGRRLGGELQSLGFINRDTLLGGLAAQANARYLAAIDRAAVATAPGGLSADEVQALGVVPFGESAGTLLVACTAPVPKTALAALAILSERAVEPYVVADDELAALQAAYGTAADAPVRSTMAKDVDEGAAQIAAFVAEAREASIKETRVDPFTWVRVTGSGVSSTLLVPTGAPEEASWQAATTQH